MLTGRRMQFIWCFIIELLQRGEELGGLTLELDVLVSFQTAQRRSEVLGEQGCCTKHGHGDCRQVTVYEAH